MRGQEPPPRSRGHTPSPSSSGVLPFRVCWDQFRDQRGPPRSLRPSAVPVPHPSPAPSAPGQKRRPRPWEVAAGGHGEASPARPPASSSLAVNYSVRGSACSASAPATPPSNGKNRWLFSSSWPESSRPCCLRVPSSLQGCPRRRGTEPGGWFIHHLLPSIQKGAGLNGPTREAVSCPCFTALVGFSRPALLLIRDGGRGSAETPAPRPSPRPCLPRPGRGRRVPIHCHQLFQAPAFLPPLSGVGYPKALQGLMFSLDVPTVSRAHPPGHSLETHGKEGPLCGLLGAVCTTGEHGEKHQHPAGVWHWRSPSLAGGGQRDTPPQPDSHGPPDPLGAAPGPWHSPRHPLTRNTLQGATKNVKI